MGRYLGLDNRGKSSQNLWIVIMTLTFFFASKLVLNCLIEQKYDKT